MLVLLALADLAFMWWYLYPYDAIFLGVGGIVMLVLSALPERKT
jgi:hypothetical protein